jgi:hypothetical protein
LFLFLFISSLRRHAFRRKETLGVFAPRGLWQSKSAGAVACRRVRKIENNPAKAGLKVCGAAIFALRFWRHPRASWAGARHPEGR